MKWLKALLGLAVLGGVAYLGLSMNGGRLPGLPTEGPVASVPGLPKAVTLPEGTPVKMLLLTPLSSGGSKEGEEVALVVAEDVQAEGKTVVRQGEVVKAKVVQSRGATLASAIANQPARLEIELGPVKTVDGQAVALVAKDGEARYEFTQANIAGEDDRADLGELLGDPEARAYVAEAVRRTVTGQRPNAVQEHEEQRRLQDLARRHKLENTQRFLEGEGEQGKADQKNLLDRVAQGDFQGLGGPELVLAAKAAGELGNLVGSVDRAVRGVFKGANLKADVGTPVVVKTGKAVKVRP